MPYEGKLTLRTPSEHTPGAGWYRHGQGWRTQSVEAALRTRWAADVLSPQPNQYRGMNANREALIAQALETEEGRTSLAEAMVAPIRREMNYQGIGRRLLMVEELPQGALGRYERDVASVAHVLSNRPPRTEAQSALIAQALETEEGRIALATAVESDIERNGPGGGGQTLTQPFMAPHHTPQDWTLTITNNPSRNYTPGAEVERGINFPTREVIGPAVINPYAAFNIQRQDLTVLPADDPLRERIGAPVVEAIGTSIMNAEAISRVNFVHEAANQATNGNNNVFTREALERAFEVIEQAPVTVNHVSMPAETYQAIRDLPPAADMTSVSEEELDAEIGEFEDGLYPTVEALEEAFEEVFVPSFEVATNPQVRLSDIRERRFNIVDRELIGVSEEELLRRARDLERNHRRVVWQEESAFPGDGSRWEEI